VPGTAHPSIGPHCASKFNSPYFHSIFFFVVATWNQNLWGCLLQIYWGSKQGLPFNGLHLTSECRPRPCQATVWVWEQNHRPSDFWSSNICYRWCHGCSALPWETLEVSASLVCIVEMIPGLIVILKVETYKKYCTIYSTVLSVSTCFRTRENQLDQGGCCCLVPFECMTIHHDWQKPLLGRPRKN
jgi:hypothetical protein